MIPYFFEDIPSMTAGQAAASNALLGATVSFDPEILFEFMEGDVKLRVVSVGVRNEAPRGATLFYGIHIPTQRGICLYLETKLMLGVIDASVGVESEREPMHLLSESEVGVIDAILLTLCELLGLPVLLAEAPASPVRGVSVTFEVSAGGSKGLGMLVLEPGIWEERTTREIPWWARLTKKTARLVIGSASFTRQELSSLLTSDTIIPDVLTCDEHGNGLGYVRVDALTQEVVISNWKSTAQGSWMEEKKIPAGATVELSIELGRTTIRLQELAQWQPGAIVPIGHKPEDPVHLVSNGKVVAHGQLVRIDNELGVRLTWVEK
jgi:hypothetical protein